MFIFGTNNFGKRRCNNDGCKCYCETSALEDGSCEVKNHKGYLLYKFDLDDGSSTDEGDDNGSTTDEESDEEWAQIQLTKHNDYRTQHGSQMMTLDSDLS